LVLPSKIDDNQKAPFSDGDGDGDGSEKCTDHLFASLAWPFSHRKYSRFVRNLLLRINDDSTTPFTITALLDCVIHRNHGCRKVSLLYLANSMMAGGRTGTYHAMEGQQNTSMVRI
jgi:hypothetical protein